MAVFRLVPAMFFVLGFNPFNPSPPGHADDAGASWPTGSQRRVGGSTAITETQHVPDKFAWKWHPTMKTAPKPAGLGTPAAGEGEAREGFTVGHSSERFVGKNKRWGGTRLETPPGRVHENQRIVPEPPLKTNDSGEGRYICCSRNPVRSRMLTPSKKEGNLLWHPVRGLTAEAGRSHRGDWLLQSVGGG